MRRSSSGAWPTGPRRRRATPAASSRATQRRSARRPTAPCSPERGDRLGDALREGPRGRSADELLERRRVDGRRERQWIALGGDPPGRLRGGGLDRGDDLLDRRDRAVEVVDRGALSAGLARADERLARVRGVLELQRAAERD